MTIEKKREYDAVITEHYRKVADDSGLAATSTMADESTRQLETDAVMDFVFAAIRAYRNGGGKEALTIMDVGCGNGYTLQRLAERFPEQQFVGIEKSDELRELASSRFGPNDHVTIADGDIREQFAPTGSVDILICQRVLINLLEPSDQRTGLDNIVSVLRVRGTDRPAGKCLFIEAFTRGLISLNEARAEFELPALSPAIHNLYLPHNFFETSSLVPLNATDIPPANFLSTHYYVTRVMHPFFTANKPFKRNSAFAAFFSEALKQNVGDFSPVRLHAFERT